MRPTKVKHLTSPFIPRLDALTNPPTYTMAQESNDDPFQAIGYGDFGTYIKNKKAKLQLQFDETYGFQCSKLKENVE